MGGSDNSDTISPLHREKFTAPDTIGKAGSYMSEDRFLKLKDAQDRFAVSRSTVWRWHAERGLRVVCVGGVTRVRESDLQAFIERHLKTAADAN